MSFDRTPWEELERPAPDTVVVEGVELRRRSRVRLRPKAGGDIMDLALAGRTAAIEGIDQDLEGNVRLAVTVDDDPGRDLGDRRQPGHRFFFSVEEVEPLREPAPAAVEPARILVAGIGNVFLGDDGFGVDDVLVDVVEDDHVDGLVAPRERLAVRAQEADLRAEALLRLRQPRDVDVDAERAPAEAAHLVGDEADRAAHVGDDEAVEVVAAEEVGEDARDLRGLDAPLWLVEHLLLEVGVGQLLLALDVAAAHG